MFHPHRKRAKDLVFCFQNSTNRMGGTLMDTPGGGKDGSGPAGIREFRPWRLVSPVQWGVSTEHGHAPANIIQIQNSNTI